MMLLTEIKSENERLKNLLELQFKLAHAFDIPYHRERKWASLKLNFVCNIQMLERVCYVQSMNRFLRKLLLIALYQMECIRKDP